MVLAPGVLVRGISDHEEASGVGHGDLGHQKASRMGHGGSDHRKASASGAVRGDSGHGKVPEVRGGSARESCDAGFATDHRSRHGSYGIASVPVLAVDRGDEVPALLADRGRAAPASGAMAVLSGRSGLISRSSA